MVRALPLCAVIACRAGDGPSGLAERYARALEDDRLGDAYALGSERFRAEVSFEAFARHYASAELRLARARELGTPGAWEAVERALIAREEPGGWRVEEPALVEGGPKSALEGFLDAVDRGDFAAAYLRLSGRWRALYTAESFAADFASDPGARERVARARLALQGPLRWGPDGVELPIGADRAVKLVREGDAYRLAAIE